MSKRKLRRTIRELECANAGLLSLVVSYGEIIRDLEARGADHIAEYLRAVVYQIQLDQAANAAVIDDAHQKFEAATGKQLKRWGPWRFS